jgi:hypothetical protein
MLVGSIIRSTVLGCAGNCGTALYCTAECIGALNLAARPKAARLPWFALGACLLPGKVCMGYARMLS